ncbi:disulfide bond formation protein B [Caldimonas thermodepolymerans]|uniref:disulfide bond formation protein B n=1 Tax=Caldimonas thermodepolymerans TaxID=215580 RepID=UPI001FB527D0|nr:disulfide bond formation protein B [Caldimonas thermodepolymerans]
MTLRLTRNALLGFTCLASFAAVAAALLSQYQFGMLPCPWCILQRFLFVMLGVVAGLAWLLPWRGLKAALAGLAVLLTGAGLAAALWQHFVAARSESCALTFADRVVAALHLESLAPKLFAIQASCADAAVSLLGLPYEAWSGALFAVLGLACLAAALRR